MTYKFHCKTKYSNLPEPGFVYIKNWSENKGILECLVEQGIIEDTGFTVPTSFVFAHLCKVLKEELI